MKSPMRLTLVALAAAVVLAGCSDGPASGSAVPHLAPGPSGSVIMSWLEPDGEGHALRYSSLSGDT